MQPRFLLFLVCFAFAAIIAACGGPPEGNAANGRKLFRGEIAVANAQKCTDCHADTVDGQSPLGPNLSNIGSRAGVTVPGKSAQDYLREAVISPDNYLAGGFQEGIHPRNYARTLSDQQVSDLVAYMETLKSGKN